MVGFQKFMFYLRKKKRRGFGDGCDGDTVEEKQAEEVRERERGVLSDSPSLAASLNSYLVI